MAVVTVSDCCDHQLPTSIDWVFS